MRSLRRGSKETPAAGPPVDKATRRSRRRFARRQWRRRWLAWRYLLVLVVVLALVGGGIWAVWFSKWLAVETIDVSGAQTVEASDIRARSGVDVGEPLARVDLASAERRIGALAVVRSVDVTRQWPNGVLISIEERVPIAVVEIGGRLRGMDADGVVFRDYKKAPPGLPARGDLDRHDLGGPPGGGQGDLGAARGPHPDRRPRPGHDASTRSPWCSRTAARWSGGARTSPTTKADVLAILLATVQASVYDVSVPSKPTTKP